jgi:hypothetical protein
MAQARGAVGTGNRRREVMARLKEMPWAALVVLILMLIVILAMWGKWPHAMRRAPWAPTGILMGLRSVSPNSLIVSAAVGSANIGSANTGPLQPPLSATVGYEDHKYQEAETHGL